MIHCYPIIKRVYHHVAHPIIHHAIRRISRHIRHHIPHWIYGGSSIVCIGGAGTAYHYLPPTLAPALWTPSPMQQSIVVPEPASIWLLGGAIAALLVVRVIR